MKNEMVTWVVYRMTIHKRADRFMAVCEQSEWDAMELRHPGYHQLVREGIPSEVEAESIARCRPEGPSANHTCLPNSATESLTA
jgi:hypothetical protein